MPLCLAAKPLLVELLEVAPHFRGEVHAFDGATPHSGTSV